MDDQEQDARGGQPLHGRIPSGSRAAALHERVSAVQRVLDAAASERGAGAGPAAGKLLESYRPRLAEAMQALGEALADFFEEGDEAVDLESLRSDFLEPILAISRHLPIFRRTLAWVTNQEEAAELQELVFAGHPAGFDAQSVLLGDYYQHREGPVSLRSRVIAAMRMMREELAARGAFDGRQVRVLVLGANAVSGLDAAMAHGQVPEFARHASLSVFIVDPAVYALRRARQIFAAAFGTRAHVLLVSPIELAQHPSRPSEPFDIVYTLTSYDALSPEDAFAFTASIVPFFKPGGVLLTGSFLPTFSRTDRALALGLAGLRRQYWDEGKWKRMLSNLPFDLEASRFEVHPPATLVVSGRRK